MSREEILYDYDWFCGPCGESGHNSGDKKIWKFCPYCGREVRIHGLTERISHHVPMAKTFPGLADEEGRILH